ncbi:type I-E CRISPR-associated protein Cse2/CasB [Methanosalsum zhilinae]|nr:type I-E CRISPR-associated protein Cse2/CasB [Methanosalsum zhilinae]
MKSSLEQEDVCKIVIQWWKDLENRKADRANLRRCHDLSEVVFTPSYHYLWHQLSNLGFKNKRAVALLAGVLAHVKENDTNNTFAGQMAKTKDGSKPKVSELRFRRVLTIDEREELFIYLVRLIKLMNGNVNICNLANSIYWWNDITKKNWAFEYYDKLSN